MKKIIAISDEEIKERVLQVVANEISKEYSFEGRMFKKMYSDTIKELIYEPKLKEEIINRTVDQATAEIRKKAMPVLSERLFGGERSENIK